MEAQRQPFTDHQKPKSAVSAEPSKAMDVIRSSMAEVYRVAVRGPLPTIRIPLRREDQDVPLQLQALIDAAYVNGRYGDDIDYREDPDPELTGPDAEWAEGVLREQGLR